MAAPSVAPPRGLASLERPAGCEAGVANAGRDDFVSFQERC